jgi:hypothetical protein
LNTRLTQRRKHFNKQSGDGSNPSPMFLCFSLAQYKP